MSNRSSGRVNTRLGVGFIGLSAKGGWASVAHLPALRSLPIFEVRAVSASSQESAEAAAVAHEVPYACASTQELVERDDVDLVVVTVKVPHHFELVSAALEAGKHVLCEWPLGNGLAETEKLAALAKQKGVRGFVGLQARSAPPVRYVRDLIREGAIGQVLSTSIIGSGRGWGGGSVDASREYLLDRANGATMLTIPFGHSLEGVCQAVGQVRSLTATTAVLRPTIRIDETGEIVLKTAEDQIAMVGELQSGAVISMHYRGGMSAGTNFLWEINGTDGDIVIRAPHGHLQYGLALVEVTGEDGKLESRRVPASYCTTATDPNSPVHTVAEAYAQIGRDLENGTAIAPTFEDAVLRHRVLAGIQRSAESGERQVFA